MVSGVIVPKDMPVPIPRTGDYVTLHDKGTLQMLLRTLTWRDDLGLPQGPNVITRVLVRVKQERPSQRKET